MPPRLAMGDGEIRMIHEAIAFYRDQELDPGYQGHFESLYTDAFVTMMGGGFADAVATGTAALFVAIAALGLPEGSEVLVSPITDPGTLGAMILNRLKPKLVDSKPGSFNVGLEQFLERVTPKTRGAILVHSIGQACDIAAIVREAHARGIKVLEDCSQSHGAKVDGQPVGTFGDIAAFSTMYRKAHMTGASGGVVYSRDRDLLRLACAHADRGKPRWIEGFDDRNPNLFLFPALNFHTDEISCAVGLASLRRLEETIAARLAFVADLTARLEREARICRPYGYTPGDSPFVYPIVVDPERLSCSVEDFGKAVRAEGIGLNPRYEYLVADWPWLKPYLADASDTPNARAIRDRSFCLYLNERYGERESADVSAAIALAESFYGR